MKVPVGILPATFTFVYVARYNGAARSRIFQGVDTNTVLGFYYLGRMLLYNCGSSLSPTPDVPNSDWITVSVRSDSLRFLGRDITSNRTNGCTTTAKLAINTGLSGDISDFAIQSVLVYNVKLSDADVQRVEAWLTAQQPAFTPANLQVRPHHKAA